MAEFLFHNDEGCLAINEEAVKALSNDFVSIMKGVYTDLSAKYDQTVNAILAESSDNSGIDFPLVAASVDCKTLAELLPPELVEKLNLKKIEEVKQIDSGEEQKQSERGEEISTLAQTFASKSVISEESGSVRDDSCVEESPPMKEGQAKPIDSPQKRGI
jgi:hypothetical protein